MRPALRASSDCWRIHLLLCRRQLNHLGDLPGKHLGLLWRFPEVLRLIQQPRTGSTKHGLELKQQDLPGHSPQAIGQPEHLGHAARGMLENLRPKRWNDRLVHF